MVVSTFIWYVSVEVCIYAHSVIHVIDREAFWKKKRTIFNVVVCPELPISCGDWYGCYDTYMFSSAYLSLQNIYCFIGTGIPIIKLKRSSDRVRFIMGIPLSISLYWVEVLVVFVWYCIQPWWCFSFISRKHIRRSGSFQRLGDRKFTNLWWICRSFEKRQVLEAPRSFVFFSERNSIMLVFSHNSWWLFYILEQIWLWIVLFYFVDRLPLLILFQWQLSKSYKGTTGRHS